MRSIHDKQKNLKERIDAYKFRYNQQVLAGMAMSERLQQKIVIRHASKANKETQL